MVTQVVRLSPVDGRIEATIRTGAWGRGITFGGGLVWATTEAGVVAIDPVSNNITRSFDLVDPVRHGQGPTAVAWLDGLLWVAIE